MQKGFFGSAMGIGDATASADKGEMKRALMVKVLWPSSITDLLLSGSPVRCKTKHS